MCTLQGCTPERGEHTTSPLMHSAILSCFCPANPNALLPTSFTLPQLLPLSAVVAVIWSSHSRDSFAERHDKDGSLIINMLSGGWGSTGLCLVLLKPPQARPGKGSGCLVTNPTLLQACQLCSCASQR